MLSFADHILHFNRHLHYGGKLPDGIRIMNPFQENEHVLTLSETFYRNYYQDTHKRHLILGINPGRFGGGTTGIPFTDPKRLVEVCHIPYEGKPLHEPSSVFVYDVIHAYGGPEAFYADFYINSICPLGFTVVDKQGKETNYNYYDRRDLQEQMKEFIVQSIQQQLTFPLYTDVCFCLGTGQNSAFLTKLNDQYHFFERIVPLDHPRFVMQYKSKSKHLYVEKYLRLLKEAVL